MSRPRMRASSAEKIAMLVWMPTYAAPHYEHPGGLALLDELLVREGSLENLWLSEETTRKLTAESGLDPSNVLLGVRRECVEELLTHIKPSHRATPRIYRLLMKDGPVLWVPASKLWSILRTLPPPWLRLTYIFHADAAEWQDKRDVGKLPMSHLTKFRSEARPRLQLCVKEAVIRDWRMHWWPP